MTAHNQRQRPFRQAARHFDVARRVGTMLAVVVMTHMGGGDNHIRFFILIQFINDQLRFGGWLAELDISEVLRVADFGRVIGGQADHGNFQPLTVEDHPRFEEALIGALLVDIGGEEGELRPLLLLAQDAHRVIELVVADRHCVITNKVHAAKIGLGIL